MRRLTARRRLATTYDERRALSTQIHDARAGATQHRLDALLPRALDRGAMRELRAARRPSSQSTPQVFEGSCDCDIWTQLLGNAARLAMQRPPHTDVDQPEVIAAPSSPEIGEFKVTAADARLQAGRMQAGRCAGADGLVAEAPKLQGEAADEALSISFAHLINDPAEPWPSSWRICKVALIPKAPRWDCFALLRPILLLVVLYKLVCPHLVVLGKLVDCAARELDDGLQSGLPCQRHDEDSHGPDRASTGMELRAACNYAKPTCARHTIVSPWGGMLHAMQSRGLPAPLIQTYLRVVLNRWAKLETPGIGPTEPIQLDHGLP